MSYAQVLKESADSRGSAFLHFVNQKSRFPDGLFVFVEDKDDIRFYSHFSQEIGDLVFIPSGGKTQILELFTRLCRPDQPSVARLGFIVDRDLDEGDAPAHEDDVLRTLFYSWESHACSPDVLTHILTRQCTPKATAVETTASLTYWENTKIAFGELLAEHGAAVRLSAQRGGGLELEKLPVTQGAARLPDRVEPGPDPQAWMTLKFDDLRRLGVPDEEIDRARTRIRLKPLAEVAHGRVLFRIFRFALDSVTLANGFDILINVSSPLDTVCSMPPDWSELDYIRDYLISRKSETA